MGQKIVKISNCGQCPHCTFDSESGDIVYWGKYYCEELERIVEPDEEIPYDCPLENAGY